jgi:hypothetical protein
MAAQSFTNSSLGRATPQNSQNNFGKAVGWAANQFASRTISSIHSMKNERSNGSRNVLSSSLKGFASNNTNSFRESFKPQNLRTKLKEFRK